VRVHIAHYFLDTVVARGLDDRRLHILHKLRVRSFLWKGPPLKAGRILKINISRVRWFIYRRYS